ncbi:MAG: hypothetical protein H6654_03195 [Ardenticatenaceae bacterium]|nr:hypothetical protein [Anaerolineales bacterium]MCB8941199.1 hypothetical protein [Ardenticatenaceae bacterium]MCB8972537.1 hypothetical protein [Ardenticatenaceae bacterium]
MTPDLLSRSWTLLRRDPFLLWLGLGMSLSSLFGTGWRLWGAQLITLNFAGLTNLQTIESLLFSDEILQMQQLLWRGLLLAFGQFVLVWLIALLAEAGIVAAVTAVSHQNPTSLHHAIQQGRRWLSRFLAIDLLVFFPWFLIALLLLLILLVLALLLASFAASEPSLGKVFTTTGVGLFCILGLALLLMPVGLVSFWVRLLTFREAVVHEVAGRTAVRQTWQRIRQHFGDVFVLVVMLWGGQTLLLGAFGLLTSPLLTWLTPLTNSSTIALQATSWLALLLVTLLVWLVRGGIAAFVAIAWTLAYLNLSEEEN